MGAWVGVWRAVRLLVMAIAVCALLGSTPGQASARTSQPMTTAATATATAAATESTAGSASAGATGSSGTPKVVLSESFNEQALTTSLLPTGWRLQEWRAGTSSTAVLPDSTATGSRYLRITSPRDNHARVFIPVTVVPSKSYLFHATVRLAGAVTDKAGAVLGIDGQFGVSAAIPADDQWHPVDLYVTAGDASAVTFTLGLGNFGSVNHGTADFRDIVVTEVQAIPDHATAIAIPTTGSTAQGSIPAAHRLRLNPPDSLVVPLAVLLLMAVSGSWLYLRRKSA